MTTHLRTVTLASLLAIFTLSGCAPDTTSISYLGVNHTDQSIVSVIVNGEGGILNVPAQGGGGKQLCCITLPKHWRPGLMATIKWQGDDIRQYDAKGQLIMNDGVPVVVEAPWKTQTVEVPEYTEKDMAHFDIHFFPGDRVEVKVSFNFPTHPTYIPAYP